MLQPPQRHGVKKSRTWEKYLTSSFLVCLEARKIARQSLQFKSDPFLRDANPLKFTEYRQCQAGVLARIYMTRGLVDLKIVRELHPTGGPPGFGELKRDLRLALNAARSLDKTTGVKSDYVKAKNRRWTKRELARWQALLDSTNKMMAIQWRSLPSATQRGMRCQS